jgi:putative ABC transport system permease protein
MLQYTVQLRSQELAIRMALGASPGDVTGMVLRRGALQAGAGIVLGLGAAIALSRYLGHRLYEVSPTDLPTYAGMSALLFLVTLAASWLAARRARRIDPVSAMKVS